MSNNGGDQNGRQPATEQAAPPTDPRTRNVPPPVPDAQRICRDFVWGICLMNEQCKYRHELEFESMRAILKFCHDFQNRTGCARPDCTYLHTSREEENLFLATGQIPRVLMERYASMSAPTVAAATAVVEAAPAPPMMYMNEYITQPPPPPPPPAASGPPPPPPAPPAAVISTTATQMTLSIISTMGPHLVPMASSTIPTMSSMASPMHSQMHQMPVMMSAPMQVPRVMEPGPSTSMMQPAMAPMGPVMSSPMPGPMPAPMPTLLAPPPPPPPTITNTPSQLTGPVYTVPAATVHQTPAIYPVTPCPQQQPPINLPVLFDPSRPPPPLPTGSGHPLKRTSTDAAEAGPSKSRKIDDVLESLCETCIQRELRCELYRQEIEKLQREKDYQRLLYEKKMEEYEHGRMLLRSMLNPDVFRILDEFIENDGVVPSSSSSSDLFSPSSPPPYASNLSTVPRQLLVQLMEYVFHTVNNNPDLPPSLEPLTRRARTPNEALATFLDVCLQNSGGNAEPRSSSDLGVNGLARLANGLDTSTPSAAAPRYPIAGPSSSGSPRYAPPAPPSRPFPTETHTNRFPEQHRPPEPAPARFPESGHFLTPPTFASYPTAPPPVPRPYYPPAAYPGPSNSAQYPPAAVVPQGARAPAPAPAVNGQNYAQYMARMPQQYYPPFQ